MTTIHQSPRKDFIIKVPLLSNEGLTQKEAGHNRSRIARLLEWYFAATHEKNDIRVTGESVSAQHLFVDAEINPEKIDTIRAKIEEMGYSVEERTWHRSINSELVDPRVVEELGYDK